MPTALTETEKKFIQQKIQEKYAKVAEGPAACFRYPTGMAGLRQLGYPVSWWQDLPPALLESFCGVGNPFSLGPIDPGEAVLDVGCGMGADACLAAGLVGPRGRVVGLDASLPMVARARELTASLSLAHLGFLVASAEKLPFPPRSFNVVMSNGVLNLVLDKLKALREMRRVLVPEGRLYLADMVLVEPLPPERQSRIENWYQ